MARHNGRRLRALRSARGMTLADLAAVLDVSGQTVGKYEKGTNQLTPRRLLELAAHFGVAVDYFFVGLPGADAPHNDQAIALRELRGFVARWGLDHLDPRARAEAREALGIGHESQGA